MYIQARDGDNVCVALSTQHFNAGRYSLVNIKESKDVSCDSNNYKMHNFIYTCTCIVYMYCIVAIIYNYCIIIGLVLYYIL